MVDTPQAANFDRKREERATEQVLQENVGRLSDVLTNSTEIWQKYFATNAAIAHYWAETFNGIQNNMGHWVREAQKTLEQGRRS